MHLRRSFALTTGAVLLAGSGLSGCGFNYATDQPYTPGEGTNDKTGPVDVLSALVVASQDDTGTLIATLVNPTADPHSVTAIQGAGESAVRVTRFEQIELSPDELVDLSDDGGFVVKGDFRQGDMLTFTFEFDSGEPVQMRVPVVRECNIYAGLDISNDSTAGPAAAATPSPTAGQTATEEPGHEEPGHEELTEAPEPAPGSDEEHAVPETAATGAAGVGPYSCEYPEPQGH